MHYGIEPSYPITAHYGVVRNAYNAIDICGSARSSPINECISIWHQGEPWTTQYTNEFLKSFGKFNN